MLAPTELLGLGVPRKRRNYDNDDDQLEEKNLLIKPKKVEPVPDLSQLAQVNWSWCRKSELSTNDAQFIDSRNVFFHPNYSHGTAAAMGNLKLTKDVMAYWEVHVEFVYGTSVMFGIGKMHSRILSPYSFENLIGGTDSNSYGLSHKGILYNNGIAGRYCDPFEERQPVVVGILFDGPNRELSYFINGNYQGVAFSELDLHEWDYYPMISSTSQKSHFTICQQLTRTYPTPLTELCLNFMAKRMKNRMPYEIKQLGLPDRLSNQIEHRVKRLQKDIKVNEPQESQIRQSLSMKPLDINDDSTLPQAFNEYLTRLAWSQYTPSQV